MSLKLMPEGGCFPTIVENNTITALVRDWKIPISHPDFDIRWKADSHYFSSKEVLCYAMSEDEYYQLIMRYNGTYTIYHGDSLYVSGNYPLPSVYRKFEPISKGVATWGNSKDSLLQHCWYLIYDNLDLGILYTYAVITPFMFSLKKNKKLMSRLNRAEFSQPLISLKLDECRCPHLYLMEEDWTKVCELNGVFSECKEVISII